MGSTFHVKRRLFAFNLGIIASFILVALLIWGAATGMKETNRQRGIADSKHGAVNKLLAQGLQSGQAIRNIFISATDKKAVQNLDKALQDQKEAASLLSKLSLDDYSLLKPTFDVFIKDCEAIRAEAFAGRALDIEAVKENTGKWRELKDVLHKLLKSYSEQKKEYQLEENWYFDVGFYWLLGIIAVEIVFISVFAIIMGRSIITPITKAVTTINEGALQISSASDQVASSSTSLAQGASEQASSVEEVSATLEEATAGVTSNTENARQADILAKQTNQAAKEGLAKGEELMVSMKDVTESAAKIANIVKTIDQIAFQVNLLALNAAVEAARAGEHGLGFAVVADEVRNLAQRAANSAKETETVIEEAVTQIKKGSEIASAASNSFKEIDDKAKKVSDLIGEVTLSSREQAEGMGQLSMAMSQIDQVTQQVVANSEETAAASEELNAQAAAAIEAVGVLAKIVGIDVNQNVNHNKTMSRPKMELKKEVRHIASKSAARAQSQRPAKNSEDIFPLDESDLKEF